MVKIILAPGQKSEYDAPAATHGLATTTILSTDTVPASTESNAKPSESFNEDLRTTDPFSEPFKPDAPKTIETDTPAATTTTTAQAASLRQRGRSTKLDSRYNQTGTTNILSSTTSDQSSKSSRNSRTSAPYPIADPPPCEEEQIRPRTASNRSSRSTRSNKTPEQALQLLMNRCAKSETCTADARKALYRWQIPAEAHQNIIDQLTSLKFIDDSRYATAYVREKALLSRWGEYKIRAGLRNKQIDEETINTALSQLEEHDMTGKLEEQLRRKMRTIKAKNTYDLRNKLLRYGVGLGFDFSDVNDLIDQLTRENGISDDE